MDDFVKFAFDQPYYFFMGWLLLSLITLFIIMMLERAVYRKRDFEDTIHSCADWNRNEWSLVILLSIFVPFGWIAILLISAIEFSPELTKEREWGKPKWTGRHKI